MMESQTQGVSKMLTLNEIRQHARDIGLGDVDGLHQTDLIHAIQIKEGHQPCFGASWCSPCKHDDCIWKEGCRAVKFYT